MSCFHNLSSKAWQLLFCERMSYVGEEDVSYNDLVDSMMQAWNGGILVANKKKNESKREEKDSSAEEGRSEPQGRIFSVPHSMLKQQTSKKREVGITAPCSFTATRSSFIMISYRCYSCCR